MDRVNSTRVGSEIAKPAVLVGKGAFNSTRASSLFLKKWRRALRSCRFTGRACLRSRSAGGTAGTKMEDANQLIQESLRTRERTLIRRCGLAKLRCKRQPTARPAHFRWMASQREVLCHPDFDPQAHSCRTLWPLPESWPILPTANTLWQAFGLATGGKRRPVLIFLVNDSAGHART